MSALAFHLDPVKAALYLARRAHEGQRDKAGEPYIMHPLRVMRAMASDDIAGQVVAVLHDVIEDTPVTIPELVLFGFSEEIVRAVDVVTHRRDETYRRYLERIAGCPLARRVKLADIADNADEARLALLRVEDAQRLREKYAQARAYLERASMQTLISPLLSTRGAAQRLATNRADISSSAGRHEERRPPFLVARRGVQEGQLVLVDGSIGCVSTKGHSLQQALAFVSVLNIDAAELYAMSPTRPALMRASARAIFAAIEGLAHVLRQLAIATALDSNRFAEALALAEVSYSVGDNGKLKEIRKDIRLESNLRISTRILAECRAPGFALDVTGEGWRALQNGIQIRNRVTHPKIPADIELSDEDMRELGKAAFWMADQVAQLGEALRAHEQAGGNLEKRLEAFHRSTHPGKQAVEGTISKQPGGASKPDDARGALEKE